MVVFDLDDTLYLERHYVRSGFQQVGEFVRNRFAVDNFAELAWQMFVGGTRGNIFDQTLKSMGLPSRPALIHELVAVYRNHEPAILMADDALQCIRRLGSTFRLALITDGPVASQERKIRALRLREWISYTILTWEWGEEYSKPHPRAYITAQRRMGVPPDQCMYVGDNPAKDFFSPRQLGWKTVRLRRANGLHSHIESVPGSTDYEFADLYPLTELLQSGSQDAGS
jgi:putative hydrolase of the HAD superfamily